MKEGTGRKGARVDASDAPPKSGVTPAIQVPDPVDLPDYSPVTENFPYPDDVISHTAVGPSPCPRIATGRR